MATNAPPKDSLGLGTTSTTKKKKTATVAKTPAAPNYNAASNAPTAKTGDLGLSSTETALPLAGDNSDLLGASTTQRTAYDAVAALHKMSKAQVDTLQQQLISADLLKKYRPGDPTDPATLAAYRSAVTGSITNQQSITTYLNGLSSTSLVTSAANAAAAKPPLLTDPQSIAVSLQNAYTEYGLGQPSAKELSQFAGQIDSKETSKDATRVSVDPTAEADVFAQQVAAKTPGATTHAEASTDADITKAAASMGVKLNDVQRSNIAAQVTANAKATGSPDVNLLNQLVAKQFRMPTDPSQLSGDAATVRNDLLSLNQQYLLPVDTTTLNSYVTKAIQEQSYAGSLADDAKAQYEQYLRGQAAIQLPGLAKSTQNFSAITPYAATASYRTNISNVLGLGNPDSVDLSGTSKYSSLLKPDANGNMPTLSEINQNLMTDPQYGYDSSPNGIARGYNVGLSLAKALGVNIGGI